MNRLHIVAISIMLITGIFSGCWQDNEKNKTRVAKGTVQYGGLFRVNEIEDFHTFYPLEVSDAISYRITAQIFEGLVKLNQKDLSILPGLAEKWEINDNATVFTFHLRKGVKFQEDPCFTDEKEREVTARSFKYCFDKLCEPSPINQGFWVFKDRVVGAIEYNESVARKKPIPGGVSGIKVLDDYTLQISLKYPFSGFLNMLVTPFTYLFPKQAVEKYGANIRVKPVGTGPFMAKEIKEGEGVILVRNENYWGYDEFQNQLPYLDGIKISFIKDKKSELLEFNKGNLDMIFQIPSEMIGEISGDAANATSSHPKYQLQLMPALSIQYYGFLNQSDAFKNKLVRQAFNFAIDREKIVDYALQGEGSPAIHGIVPPSLKAYDNKNIRGYSFNPDTAKKLLAKAGFPDGKGFPKIFLQLNSGGSRNTQVAEVVQKMLKENLNIDIELNIMPLSQHVDNFEKGNALFWRIAWIADYPDAESFLNTLYGAHVPQGAHDKAYLNSVRYKNAAFDSLFELALKEVDDVKRNQLFMQADQVAMDDAALMPLYYDENMRLLQPYVRNLDVNAMEYRDFSKVYFEKEKPAEKTQADAPH